MIVTLNSTLVLRKVDSETEAFYEMRRFLEVNNEEAKYVEVRMWDDEGHDFKRVIMAPYTFGIHYQTEDNYDFLYFERDESKWDERLNGYFIDLRRPIQKKIYYDKIHYVLQGGHYARNEESYNRVVAYFNDLEQREKVSSECH